jgi:hypothetical protein
MKTSLPTITLTVLGAVASVTVAAPGPNAANSQNPASSSPQGNPSASTYTFDLHNDPTLDVPPLGSSDSTKPSAVLLCFAAVRVIGSTSQPLILRGEPSDVEGAIVTVQRAGTHVRDALNFFDQYVDLARRERAETGVSDEAYATNTTQLRKELKKLKHIAAEARTQADKGQWRKYAATAEKLEQFLHDVKEFKKWAEDSFSQIARVGSEGNEGGFDRARVVNDSLKGLRAAGLSAASDAAAAEGDVADAQSTLGTLVGGLKIRCANPADPEAVEQGVAAYVRVDFSAVSDAEWNDLKLAVLSVTTTATSPSNPTPVRASPAAPQNTIPGNNAAPSGETKSLKQSKPAEQPSEVKIAKIKYFRIPSRLAGDTIVSVNMSLLYTTPLPQSVPIPGQYYPAGSSVTLVTCYKKKPTANAPGKSPDQDSPNWDQLAPPCNAKWWVANQSYNPDEIVQVPSQCYVAKRGLVYDDSASLGSSDDWQQQSCSASTNSQTVVADTSIPVVNQSLPPVHALSRFNLTTGVVLSNVRMQSFGFVAASSPSTICATQPATSTNVAVPLGCAVTSSTRIVDPVLFISYYFIRPLDAERPWDKSDLLDPAFSLGLSLASPTSNFYLGFSEEIQRNVQLTAGVMTAKTPHLATIDQLNAPPSGMATSPATVSRFTTGWYVGISFNVLGFIQSLFPGGGGSKGSGGS